MNVVERKVREGFVKDEPVPVADERPEITLQPAKTPRAAPPPTIENPPPPLPDEQREQWPLVVPLYYKPIVNNTGETLNALTFREPRGGDINRYGNPVRLTQEGEIVIEERKMHYMMAALCGVLPPLLEALHPRDWNTCAYKLRNFFLPDLRAF